MTERLPILLITALRGSGYTKGKIFLQIILLELLRDRNLASDQSPEKSFIMFFDNLPKYKSPGPGYIPAWALNVSKQSIGTHLNFVVNECINKKTFPNILKTAHVTPVYKKGDRLEPENYRSISLTPTLAKIFERLLLEQLTHPLSLIGLINKNQTEFEEQKSCLDTMIS